MSQTANIQAATPHQDAAAPGTKPSSPEAAVRSSTASDLVRVENLEVSFRAGKGLVLPAVKGISFSIPRHSTVALVGESGSGKSVSAMSLLRLLPENAVVGPSSRILYTPEGATSRNLLELPMEDLRALRGRELSVIFQEPMSSLNPVLTIGDQIAEVLQWHLKLSHKQAMHRAEELLAEVGIPEPKARLGSYPHELSGGQQQRAMIAIAIACEPKLLIADEPTTALDVTIQRQILDLLASLQARHAMSILFISHDLGVVGEIADQVIVMKDGVVRESGPVEQIFAAPQDSYTRALLACRPKLDARPRRLPVIDDFLTGRPIETDQRGELPPDGSPLITATNIEKVYRLKTGLFSRKSVVAVKDANFKLYPGRTLGIVGESGSGKTTLGLLLMRLVDASSGKAMFDDQDILAISNQDLMPYRRRMQIIFQNPYASLNPRFTVGQILTEPMRIHGIGASADERMAMAMTLLRQVGLPEISITKYPHEFSGGQRQRIAIARCLALKPEVLICDESVSALDVSVQATVLNLLLDLQETYRLSYIFISHDLAVVRYMADEILVMSQGLIVEAGSSRQIYEAPSHPYTKKLLESIPRGFVSKPTDHGSIRS